MSEIWNYITSVVGSSPTREYQSNTSSTSLSQPTKSPSKTEVPRIDVPREPMAPLTTKSASLPIALGSDRGIA